MSRHAPWLPSETLSRDRVARPFVDLVADWGGIWFGNDAWRAASAFAPATTDDLQTLCDGLSVKLQGRAKASLDLGFALLGASSRSDNTESDLRLLRRLAHAALDDLQHRAEDLIAAARPSAGSSTSRWSLAVGPNATPVIQLNVAEDAVVAVARKTFRPTAHQSALSERGTSWRDMSIDYCAYLGQARLAVRQVSALERGDIIVLDQPAGEPVRLVVAGQPTDLRFAIGSDGDHTKLIMQDS